MREIKFRAIHKLTKKKWDEEDLVFHSGKWYENWRAFEDGIPLNLQQCAVMQYTGLTDKNGVEIYEGDILQLGNTLSVVEYRISQFVLKEIAEDHHPNVLEFEVYKQSISSEVVGNIYENPELLEGDTK